MWVSWDAVDGVQLQTVGSRFFEDRAAEMSPRAGRNVSAIQPKAPVGRVQQRIPDTAREMASALWSDSRKHWRRWETSNPAVEVLKSELTKAKSILLWTPKSISAASTPEEKGASRSWMPSAQRSVLCSQRPLNPPPLSPKCQSEGRDPSQKNVSRRRRPTAGDAFTLSKKHGLFCSFVLAPGVVLDIREGQPGPLRLTFFWRGRGVPTTGKMPPPAMSSRNQELWIDESCTHALHCVDDV